MTDKEKISTLIEALVPEDGNTDVSRKLFEAISAVALEEYATLKAKLAESDEDEGAAAWDAAADSGVFDLLDALQQVKAFPPRPYPRRPPYPWGEKGN